MRLSCRTNSVLRFFSSSPLFVVPALAQPPPAAGAAAASTSDALTPEQARRALETLQDDQKRGEIINTLRAIANASPSGAAAPAAPAPEQNSPIPLSADGLGAQLLLMVSEQIGEMSREVADVARTLTHFPAFYYWIVRTANDPAAYGLLIDIAWKLALVFGCALAAEWVMFRLIRRPVAFLEAARAADRARCRRRRSPIVDPPSSIGRRHRRARSCTSAAGSAWRGPGRSVLRLPLRARAPRARTASRWWSSSASPPRCWAPRSANPSTVRLVILAVVNAYAFSRGADLRWCGRSPARSACSRFGPRPRPISRSGPAASSASASSGIAFANVALLLGLHRAGYAALLRMVMLVVHLFIVVIILQCRRQVAEAIRAPADRHGLCGRAAQPSRRRSGIISRSRSISRCGRCGRSTSATAIRCCCNISSAPSRSR